MIAAVQIRTRPDRRFVILSTIMHIFFNLPVAVRSMYSLKPNVNIRIGGIVFNVHDESSERI